MVRFFLSVDGLSEGHCYFDPSFVVRRWTEQRAMQIELASVRRMIQQWIADRTRMTETGSISVVLSTYQQPKTDQNSNVHHKVGQRIAKNGPKYQSSEQSPSTDKKTNQNTNVHHQVHQQTAKHGPKLQSFS